MGHYRIVKEEEEQDLIWCSNMVGLTICYEVYRLFWALGFNVFSMCFMSTIVVYSSWLRSSILDPQGWIEWGLEILSELLTKQIQAGS
jgi:hypothetical protein